MIAHTVPLTQAAEQIGADLARNWFAGIERGGRHVPSIVIHESTLAALLRSAANQGVCIALEYAQRPVTS